MTDFNGIHRHEQEAIRLSADLARTMRRIIAPGPAAAGDTAEMVAAIHVLQRMVMSQVAARAHPDLLRQLGGDVPAAAPEPHGYPVEGTNSVLLHPVGQPELVYASCMAHGCTWVGPARRTAGLAVDDARRHQDAEGNL